MAEKVLRIFFSGISTLTPGPPRPGDPTPKKAFVLMAANREAIENDFAGKVEPHAPYLFVPESRTANPAPAAATVENDKLGKCFVYYLDNARLVFAPELSPGISYHVEKKDLAERPGSADVASENDIRWMADSRDIVPAFTLKQSVDPAAANVGDAVALVVELTQGTWKASFPCKTVQSMTFMDATTKQPVRRADGTVLKRVFANEFFIEIAFPATQETVKLQLKELRQGAEPTGLGKDNELVLRWGDDGVIDVHMGNDTKRESLLASSPQRCDARRLLDSGGKPVIVKRDDDFFLHYQLTNIPPGQRPLPQNGPQQTHINGCVPLTTTRPPGQ